MQHPRRVLMLAPTSFFKDYGCHIRILEEARALIAQAVQVRIVTYYLGRDWPGLDIVRSRPTPWRTDYEVGSSRHKIAFDALLSWRALEQTLKWRPHLIHGHLHEGALIGHVLSTLARVPLVFDFQGSLTGEMLDHGFVKADSAAYAWWRRLEERIVDLPDAIITSTAHSAALLRDEFGRQHEVYPLHDSVNLDFVHPDCLTEPERCQLRRRWGVPEGRKVIVYLGLLADYQGIPQLLRAAVALRERGHPVTFLIMGFPAVDRYRHEATSLGLSAEDVIFTGQVPYEEMPHYLAVGDVAVAPKLSATEGSGKLLNYMGMGLPVVAYDSDVNREYLGDSGVYAAPLGDVSSLADALAGVLDAPGKAGELGVQLRERARCHFSWNQTGVDLLSIYEHLWEERGRRRDRAHGGSS